MLHLLLNALFGHALDVTQIIWSDSDALKSQRQRYTLQLDSVRSDRLDNALGHHFALLLTDLVGRTNLRLFDGTLRSGQHLVGLGHALHGHGQDVANSVEWRRLGVELLGHLLDALRLLGLDALLFGLDTLLLLTESLLLFEHALLLLLGALLLFLDALHFLNALLFLHALLLLLLEALLLLDLELQLGRHMDLADENLLRVQALGGLRLLGLLLRWWWRRHLVLLRFHLHWHVSVRVVLRDGSVWDRVAGDRTHHHDGDLLGLWFALWFSVTQSYGLVLYKQCALDITVKLAHFISVPLSQKMAMRSPVTRFLGSPFRA